MSLQTYLEIHFQIYKEIRLKIGTILHHQGIKVKKVRSVDIKKEPLVRIIDAMVGAVREMAEGQKDITEKLDTLIKDDRLKILYK